MLELLCNKFSPRHFALTELSQVQPAPIRKGTYGASSFCITQNELFTAAVAATLLIDSALTLCTANHKNVQAHFVVLGSTEAELVTLRFRFALHLL